MTFSADTDIRKIFARRDRRFDGRVFIGVKTTRIYCRPICPAKPKLENLRMFRSAAEAENHGYRPCLRCRPELAPTSKFLEGTSNTVSRALRIIADTAAIELSIESLAGSLGVSERHLRRLFDQHLGASPLDVLLTQRLHFAKRLVQSTRLPFSQVAFMSGFQSVRRFNEAFKERYRVAPSVLRRKGMKIAGNELKLQIAVSPPYDWEHVIAYLSRHECFGVERVTDDSYQRFIPIDRSFGTVTVSRSSSGSALEVGFENIPLPAVRGLLRRVENLFDTHHNPAFLPGGKDNGIRVPGSFDPFETAISIILGQLVSTEHAKLKLKALVQAFGRKIAPIDSQEIYEFPSAQTLAEADVVVIGVTRIKAEAIRSLAAAVRDRHLDFQAPQEFSAVARQLLSIRGVGEWTAEMITMRCFGNPDAFPRSDLIVKRALDKKLIKEAEWTSSRAYLTHCVWRDYATVLKKQNEENMKASYQRYASPIGKIYLVERNGRLVATIFESHWSKEKQKFAPLSETETPLLKKAKKQLTEYFAGKRKDFDLPYELNGTDFQKRTWEALAKIPFGETRSYAAQAKSLKSPNAVRAVGRTNGLNPLAIILPCHRVVGSNGTLTGYAGGLEIKKFLLQLEGIELGVGDRC